MLEEIPVVSVLVADKSPKSVALPVFAIVIYSIIFTSPGKIELKPSTGKLLLWDGRYNHMVPKHKSDNPRIIVAGNLNWQLPDKKKYV